MYWLVPKYVNEVPRDSEDFPKSSEDLPKMDIDRWPLKKELGVRWLVFLESKYDVIGLDADNEREDEVTERENP